MEDEGEGYDLDVVLTHELGLNPGTPERDNRWDQTDSFLTPSSSPGLSNSDSISRVFRRKAAKVFATGPKASVANYRNC